jgi:replicative DNA helicase
MQVIDKNTEMETLVLKAMMLIHNPNDTQLIEAFDILDKRCFTQFDHQIIFNEMLRMHIHKEHITAADLVNPLLALDPRLLHFLSSADEDVTGNSLISWSKKLTKLRDRREYIDLFESTLKSLTESGHDEDWEKAINNVPDVLMNIKNNDVFSDSGVYNAKECVKLARERRLRGDVRVSTGFEGLDLFFQGGLKLGTLTVIGAPPSTGKTELSSRLALNISSNLPGKEAIIFSLEMSNEDMEEKLVEHMANKPIIKMSESELIHWEDAFSKTGINICDKATASIEFMRTACKRIQLRSGISVIIVDFIDKMAPPSKSVRHDLLITDITSKLKDLAKDFNCIVIALTQLNKAAINKPDKRPTMNDSKNSNGAAENADYWIGLKRIGQWDFGKKYPDSHLLELIIDKNRYGDQGIFYLAIAGHLYQEINQDQARSLVDEGNSLRKEEIKNKYKKETAILDLGYE